MRVEAVLPAMRITAGGLPSAVAVPLFTNGSLRMVGPFVTFVHMLPASFAPDELPEDSDVRAHPHIGIAAVSYVIDGAMTHRDALGQTVEYGPGDVGWMSAGRGLTHSERYAALRRQGGSIEAFQFWVALPDEDADPEFSYWPAETLPWIETEGVKSKLIAGRVGGSLSPVKTESPLFLVDVILSPGAAFDAPPDYRERAAYVVSGAVSCDGQRAEAGQTLLFAPDTDVRLEAEGDARLICFGGAPMGPRLLWWNLVASDLSRIEAMKAAWREQRIPLPVGDDADFTPCPADDGRPLLHLQNSSN